MTLQLSALEPFARGGNRLCFVHPQHPDRCIKVRRPDRPLTKLRAQKRFPKNLRPLSSFDDNLEEFRVMKRLHDHYGDAIFTLVSRCFGFEDTDLGRGITSELIRDADGPISHTLKQYLWDHGYTEQCQQVVNRFSRLWLELAVPSRDLILHNLVVQRDSNGNLQRLVIIDGLGAPNMLPDWLQPLSYRRRKAQRKIQNLQERIEELLSQRGTGRFPGYHGQLYHNGLDNDRMNGDKP